MAAVLLVLLSACAPSPARHARETLRDADTLLAKCALDPEWKWSRRVASACDELRLSMACEGTPCKVVVAKVEAKVEQLRRVVREEGIE